MNPGFCGGGSRLVGCNPAIFEVADDGLKICFIDRIRAGNGEIAVGYLQVGVQDHEMTWWYLICHFYRTYCRTWLRDQVCGGKVYVWRNERMSRGLRLVRILLYISARRFELSGFGHVVFEMIRGVYSRPGVRLTAVSGITVALTELPGHAR